MGSFARGIWISSRPAVIPSVFSNMLAGWCLGGGLTLGAHLGTVTVTAAGGLLFYLAGMWGNDFLDAEWDTRHRSRRPVPMGLIRRMPLGLMSLLALLGALWLLPVLPALGLALCIIIYNLTHKKWKGAVFFMGGCRSFLVLTAACMAGDYTFLLVMAALVLGVYVAAVTWWARREDEFPERIPLVGRLLSYIPLGDACWLVLGGYFLPSAGAVALFFAGMGLRKLGQRAS